MESNLQFKPIFTQFPIFLLQAQGITEHMNLVFSSVITVMWQQYVTMQML